MRDRQGKRGRANFRVGQVVAIRGLGFPVGCVVLKLKLSDHMWLGTVECANKEDDREFTEGELRSITAGEYGVRCGPAKERKPK